MKRVVNLFTRLCQEYLPDAFVFSMLLTLTVFVMAIILTPHSAVSLVEFWGKDFWSLNAFAMQMVFILISGHMLASTQLVKKVLSAIVHLVPHEAGAIVVLSVFSILTCFMNWGFGLIVSGILAIELAQKLKRVNFGLFVATAYSGFIVWHGGLSGSIPLKMAARDEVLGKVYPGLSIDFNQTVFSSWNLLIVVLLLVTLPIVALWMRNEEKVEIKVIQKSEIEIEPSKKWNSRIENSPILNVIFFVGFLVIMAMALKNGESLDINKVNGMFLFFAIFLHKTPRRFLNALNDSFGYASSIVIQFPFYAGLMGLMQYSGLANMISEVFVNISTARTLPLWSFLSGGIVNFFVPSGGGQWVVQGPIMLGAAQKLQADPAKVSMALAWGDAWTNLIQPFWALPLLALAKIGTKEIMGYCLIYTVFSGLVIATVLLWF